MAKKAELTVTPIEGVGFSVQSGANNYTVTIETCADRCGSLYFIRRCNCRAGEFGRHCKHVDAIESFEWAAAANENDYDAMDMLERCS